MEDTSLTIVAHGRWSLDVERELLRVDEAVVRLQPGVLRLLLFLISNEGRVVPKEDLVEVVWEGRAVSDAAIYNRVNALRTALGDNDEEEPCIRWEYGRGLRFLRPLTRTTTKAPDPTYEDERQRHQSDTAPSFLAGRPAGAVPIEQWRHLLGTYFIYYNTPSWPNAIKLGVSTLSESDGLARVQTIERGQDQHAGIQQDSGYLGQVEYVDGRIYVLEQNQEPPRSICLTVLDAPHAFQPDTLIGMMMGSSWRLRGAPYSTRVIWKRLPQGMSLDDAIQQSGPIADLSDVDNEMLRSLSFHCLTIDQVNNASQQDLDADAEAPLLDLPPHDIPKTGPSRVAVSRFDAATDDADLQKLAKITSTDIATSFSKFREMRVVARDAAHYVLEGGLRSGKGATRLTANLIDARSETQIWASSYELTEAEMPTSHDQAMRSIIASVDTVLRDDQLVASNSKEAEDLSAWECYLRGMSVMHTFDTDAQAEAIALFQHGIELAPDFADLYAVLSYAMKTQTRLPNNFEMAAARGNRRTSGRIAAHELAQRAISMDSRIPFAWVALGRSHLGLGDFENAVLALERALELNPNLGWAHFMLGYCYWPQNRVDEALVAFEIASETLIEENCQWTVIAGKACALMAAGRFEDAIDASLRAQIDPRADQFAYCPEICSLSKLGRYDDARKALRKANKAIPNFGLELIEYDQALPDPGIRKLIADGLKRAQEEA